MQERTPGPQTRPAEERRRLTLFEVAVAAGRALEFRLAKPLVVQVVV